jgi:ABC-type Na+ efflux pump permease subunit
MEASEDPKMYGPYPSQRMMEDDLANGYVPELGLVIPADVNQQIDRGDGIELAGYVMHWISEKKATEMAATAEAWISDLVDRPVHISLEGNTVDSGVDTFGFTMWASLGLVIGIVMVGGTMVPNMMIEEKHTQTMRALLVSPARPGHVVMAKALVGMLYCFIVSAGIFAFGSIIAHGWLFLLAVLCGALLAVAVGLLLGSIFDNRQQLMLWGFLCYFPLLLPLFLSMMKGLIPEGVRSVLLWWPTVLLGKVFRVSFSGSVPRGPIAVELLVILTSALAMLAVVGWIVRRSDR